MKSLPALALFLKNAPKIFTFFRIFSANGCATTSQHIRLMQCDIHRTFSIIGYLFTIISRAFRTFDPLSLIIAENFDGPILIRTSSIFLARKSPVCDSVDKSESRKIYSFRVGVRTVKFHTDRLFGDDHSSKANFKLKHYYKFTNNLININ